MVMLNKLCLAKYEQQNEVKNRSYERFNTGNKIIYIPIHIKGFIFARLFDFLPCSNSSSLIWSKIWSDANFCSQSFWGFFYYWFYDYASSYVTGSLELTISCLRDWLLTLSMFRFRLCSQGTEGRTLCSVLTKTRH